MALRSSIAGPWVAKSALQRWSERQPPQKASRKNFPAREALAQEYHLLTGGPSKLRVQYRKLCNQKLIVEVLVPVEAAPLHQFHQLSDLA